MPPSLNLSTSVNSLKRPRSTSNPPSPTGSSSSKKAASEDSIQLEPSTLHKLNTRNLSPGVPGGSGGGMVTVNGGPGSSPLRVDVEDDGMDIGEMAETKNGTDGFEMDDDGNWVKKTEDVHIDDDEERTKTIYADLYNELLSSSPPPFNTFEKYFIIPNKIFEDLKAIGFGQSASKSSVSTPGSSLNLDMSLLVKEASPEQVYVIDTEVSSGGSRSLSTTARLQPFWRLKDGLMEDEDFKYITEQGWKKLISALGVSTGPSLSRFCLPGDRIQLVPPVYTLHMISQNPSIDQSPPVKFTCPSETPISTFLQSSSSILADKFDTAGLPSRIWQFDPNLPTANRDSSSLNSLHHLEVPSTLVPALAGKLLVSSEEQTEDTCSSRGMIDGDSFILEYGSPIRDQDIKWSLQVASNGEAVQFNATMPPVPTAPAPLFSKPAYYGGSGNKEPSASNGQASMSSSVSSLGETSISGVKKNSKPRGLVGLVNLGNTCFMNSAVQCLSNTMELNDYFLSGVYRDELNRDNPLGMHGQVAEAFGAVIEALWGTTSPNSSFSPRQLKYTTSRFASQFAGYGQHDTQEFIAFLLDGLHEDLNRIIKKPYIEKPDWKAGGSEKELALLGRDCWEGYKKRNDSVIVDLFQGQLMSTLVCPECHKESITMDPFMYLTVPLPVAQTRELKLTFFPRDTDKPPVRVQLLISANASFLQLKEKLGKLMGCDPSHLIGFDLWKGGVYTWWIDNDHNSEFKENDEAVFHDLGIRTTSTRKAVGTNSPEGSFSIPVYTFKPSESRYRNEGEIPSECSLAPFFITISKSEAGDAMAVREAIAKGYSRFIKQDMSSHLWVPSTSSHATVPLPPSEEEGEDKVTEIHLDGSIQNQQQQQQQQHQQVTSPVNSIHSRSGSPVQGISSNRNASSASLATLSSIRSGKIVPRGDLYRIHVADVSTMDKDSSFNMGNMFKSKDPNVAPLYKGNPSQASGHWSLLESRRKARKNMLSRITSGLSSMVGVTSPEEDLPISPTSAKEGAGPQNGGGQPVIRPGEAIFCEWPVNKYHEYFDESALINSFETIEDPAIEKERAKKKNGKSINIEDCLDEFSKEETLGQEDLWFCPICKKHQAATKKLEIYKAPDILVICIKRFGNGSGGGGRRLSDKLDNLVNFPIEDLDLNNRIYERKVQQSLKLSNEEAREMGMDGNEEEWVYDLYAVDNHFGGLGGGHYTAFCKNKDNGEWYNYDDSRVSKVSNVESIQSRAAYLLFYRRRTIRPIGGISRLKAEEAISRSASRNASRSASPVPPSPNLAAAGPSQLRHQVSFPSPSPPDSQPLDSSSSSTSDDLPSYSARESFSPPETPPSAPCPSLSAGVASDLGFDNMDLDSSKTNEMSGKGGGFGAVSSSIGYGNTTWGGLGKSKTTDNSVLQVRHQFGRGTSPNQANDDDVPPNFPTPPDTDSEDGFERLRVKKKEEDKGHEGNSDSEVGLGEAYGVLKPTSDIDSGMDQSKS